jgi:hypothetical protein
VLALKCLSVDHLTLRTLYYLNSAMLTALKEESLNDSGLSAKTYRLGVAAIGVLVANRPVGHFFVPSLGKALIAPLKGDANPPEKAPLRDGRRSGTPPLGDGAGSQAFLL